MTPIPAIQRPVTPASLLPTSVSMYVCMCKAETRRHHCQNQRRRATESDITVHMIKQNSQAWCNAQHCLVGDGVASSSHSSFSVLSMSVSKEPSFGRLSKLVAFLGHSSNIKPRPHLLRSRFHTSQLGRQAIKVPPSSALCGTYYGFSIGS